MSSQPFSFSLRLVDFDVKRLPIAPTALEADPELLQRAVSEYYAAIFRKLGGTASVAISEGAIHVAWNPAQGDPRRLLLDRILGLLNTGEYREAEPLLQGLLSRFPEDPDALYNYGMILSDQGHFEKATELLEHLVGVAPDYVNGWTALGVACLRKGQPEAALAHFRTALDLEPSNPYALRNAGTLLVDSAPEEALGLLQRALQQLPNDQATLLGYGNCLLALGRKDEADIPLKKCVELDQLSPTAEQARAVRSRIAHLTMREGPLGSLRMDVVSYCVAALEKFRELGDAKSRSITAEVAMLGRRGLNIHDPAKNYTLAGLPGRFSGMELVSMMYVGVRLFLPGSDPGIDLSPEYEEAVRLSKTK